MNHETSLSVEWLPDELLFSLASRHHVTACHVRAADTCRALFGHHRAGSAHDFPSRIDEFARRSGGLWGDAESIIRQRTILPFYLPVQTPGAAADAVASMRSDAIGPLKASLGLLASGFGASHALKACPQCMEADEHAVGTAYWHRAHQLPGAWICLKHDAPLFMSTLKSTGVGRFLWHLPDRRGLQGPWVALRSPEPIELWRGLTECIEHMAALPKGFHFEPGRLMTAHRAAAARWGFISSTGRLLPAALGQRILETTQILANAQDLLCLASDERAAVAQFARLLYQPRGRTHPLKHCILALTLHGGWSSFMANYRDASDGQRCIASGELRKAPNRPSQAKLAPARQELIDLMRNGGLSATAAARATGIAVATAMAWANDAGISVAPRAKTLKPEVRLQAVRALRRGRSKQEVANTLAVSVTTITRLLRTEHGLREEWRRATTARMQRKARSDWLAAARRCPGASPTEVRRSAPAAFAWLYRNDRAWLEGRAKQLSPAARIRTPRVDWDRRDEALSLEVLRASVAISQQRQVRRVTLGVMCQHVSALRPFVNKLDRLPRTRVALDRVLRRRDLRHEQLDLFEE